MSRRLKLDPALIPQRPHLDFERQYWEQGLKYVGGIDEAGRGALAGPVYAAVAVLPDHLHISAAFYGVRDSKQMTAREREIWADRLRQTLVAFGIGWSSSQEIDELGIVPSVRLAVQRAIGRLRVAPQHLLVDFLDIPESPLPQTPIIKGDARSLSIASASILAKTARDAYMCELDRYCPGYGFAAHKGYGTLAHREAICRLGRSPHHRQTFKFRSDDCNTTD